MPQSIVRNGRVWDLVVGKKPHPDALSPVWMKNKDDKFILCQVQNTRFGWTVVVSGPVVGPRMVEGFKQRWQAIKYAVGVRNDLERDAEEKSCEHGVPWSDMSYLHWSKQHKVDHS